MPTTPNVERGHDPEIIRQRIKERLDALALTANAAAVAAGFANRKVVGDILRGTNNDPKASTLIPLARALRCSVDYLLGRVDDPSKGGISEASQGDVVRLQVMNVVQVNVWRDQHSDLQLADGSAPFFVRDLYEGIPQWAEVVRGTSFWPEGSFLRVLEAKALNYRPKSGDRVIAVTHRDGGLFERSARELRPSPASDGKTFVLAAPGAPDRLLGEDGGLSTEIVGVVRGVFIPE